MHFPSKGVKSSYSYQKALNKSVETVFDFVFSAWMTHLVRAELKVYHAPYGTSAAGSSKQFAA